MLGPLQDNGGPTWTHAPLSGSPAIDQGKSFGLTTDQRGQPRPFDIASIANASGGDGSDIGAFELIQATSPVLSIARSLNDIVLSWPTANAGFALECATNLPSQVWTSAGLPTIVNGQFIVTNSPSGTTKFYRLKQ